MPRTSVSTIPRFQKSSRYYRILEEVSAGDLFVGFLSSAGSTRLMSQLARDRARERYANKLALRRLEACGYVRRKSHDGKISFSVTAEGKRTLRGLYAQSSRVVMQTDGTYQYNGASISKVKLSDKMKNYLEGEGSLQLVLSGYSKKVGFLKTDIDSQLSTAFSGGSVSNTSSASSSLNWAGVDNSALWTVTVQTDVNGVQYNEYTIPASTWNSFSTFYSIPLAQLRVLIIRGDGTNDPSTLASTYSGVSGYNPASPLASVAAYEALGYDVPANIVDGSQLASPTTNVATGIGAEIGPAGGTGPTVVRFKVSDTTINGIRQTNEGNIKILVFRAGAANTGSNVFIHSINLSISSGETASFANAVDKYEP
jgi:DNA-binding MarR family transcriptional regulator